MAARLISGLVNEQLDMGMAGSGAAVAGAPALGAAAGLGLATSGAAGAEAVAASLQAVAPSYFRQEDRTYYQVKHTAPSQGERMHSIHEIPFYASGEELSAC